LSAPSFNRHKTLNDPPNSISSHSVSARPRHRNNQAALSGALPSFFADINLSDRPGTLFGCWPNTVEPRSTASLRALFQCLTEYPLIRHKISQSIRNDLALFSTRFTGDRNGQTLSTLTTPRAQHFSPTRRRHSFQKTMDSFTFSSARLIGAFHNLKRLWHNFALEIKLSPL
jgi:hypothetical protein